MKYVIFLGDGMADLPTAFPGGKTPLDLANKPHMDRLATTGRLYSVHTVPAGFTPGSDVANMAVMGLDPKQYYSGRSSLEAVSMGVDLKETDLSFRVNLVTLTGTGALPTCTMADYSAGEISTAEARKLIEFLAAELGSPDGKLYPGVSYRHCYIKNEGQGGNHLTPPHDITGRKLDGHLPTGPEGTLLLQLIEESRRLLKDHPVNLDRRARGLNEATALWPWGEGRRPSFPSLQETYGIRGAVISAVDLVQGIGLCAGLEVIKVPGATGTLTSNFTGKAKAAITALQAGTDFVYLHMEAPDECGHQGDAAGKVKAIEIIDNEVIKPVWDYLEASRQKTGEDYRLLVLPDHPTPLALQTHTADPVPAALFDSRTAAAGGGKSTASDGETAAFVNYSEQAVQRQLQTNPAETAIEAGDLFRHFIRPLAI